MTTIRLIAFLGLIHLIQCGISCGGIVCVDGFTFGSDGNAPQATCQQREQEACASHGGPRAGTQDIDCASQNSAKTPCAANGNVVSIQLIQQYSSSPCQSGSSFGPNGAGIWVDRGCRGRFRLTLGGGAAPPAPAPTGGPMAFIGCFRDNANRDINGYHVTSDSMTVETCNNECKSRGNSVFGLQYKVECFCGNSYGKYGGASDCNTPCNGNAGQTCGGAWANSVWRVGTGGGGGPVPPTPSPPAGNPGSNKYGMGLIGPGNDWQMKKIRELTGDNGWVLVIHPGVTRDTGGPPGDWIQGLNLAYQNGLNAVVRLGPPWGGMNIRDSADDGNKRNYNTLAQAYKRVVQGLPKPSRGSLWIQVHNEPDLCYEWWCRNAGPVMGFEQLAAEFTAFYVQVYDAIKSIGDGRIKVGFGALAPGGARQCGCCGGESCPNDQAGITGLQFMDAMRASRGDVWNKLDFFASHAYPASNIGWGFNVPWPQARPGLEYYKQEMAKIGRSVPLLITETGWASNRPDLPKCSENDKAAWTVEAYNNVWNADPAVTAVLPFMFQDGHWGDNWGYHYVRTDGAEMPIFGAIKNNRRSRGIRD